MSGDWEAVMIDSEELKRLKALHHRLSFKTSETDYRFCAQCGGIWPCTTIQLVAQAQLAENLTKPPPGWYTLGTHAFSDYEPDMKLEFWGVDAGGMPLWERPILAQRTLISQVWEQGMVAAKLQAATGTPVRNPYLGRDRPALCTSQLPRLDSQGVYFCMLAADHAGPHESKAGALWSDVSPLWCIDPACQKDSHDHSTRDGYHEG